LHINVVHYFVNETDTITFPCITGRDTDKQSVPWRAWERYEILAYNEQDNGLTDETVPEDKNQEPLASGHS